LGGSQGNNRAWTTNRYGNYKDGDDSYLYSPRLDFSGVSCPYITFDLKWETENCCDYLTFEHSVNGGSTWTVLGTSSDPNWYNSGTTWRESSGGLWKHMEHALSSMAGDSCVLLRFRFHSDGSVNYGGIAMDNVQIFDNLQDMGVIAIVTPSSICKNTSAEPVTVTIKNFGCSSVSNVPVTFTYVGPNGGSMTEIVPGPIAPGSYVDYTCTHTVDMSGAGAYTFTIITQYPGDARVANDTISVILNQLVINLLSSLLIHILKI